MPLLGDGGMVNAFLSSLSAETLLQHNFLFEETSLNLRYLLQSIVLSPTFTYVYVFLYMAVISHMWLWHT